ncbi:alpha/beta-hydrolase [Polyplosphaeria fusca]|uniref:Alpha/beta-hydrolase n=1 Tax=Polyplosphaeria fusca TaxID=682080 RepID=A0A9P4QNT5_9PLEO|nr:alpha/beta-hydrolase [Polyplosphaeria fusca]
MGDAATIGDEGEAVLPYSMHVSSRYLDLTKKKLQLTRLPRELQLSEERRWEQGTPKALLEPLLDYWLEHYDWRTQEARFNSSLPQFRTTVQIPPLDSDTDATARSLRIHFVHKPSKHKNAIPLLFCHTWPSSFVEVQKIIDALTDPQSLPSFGAGAQQAFHVVAPSIPGFGFSDASANETFGLKETAVVFNGLMEKLGYSRYVAHGTGCICRALALGHSQSCVAVHTANPSFSQPTLKRSPLAYAKYHIARLTRAKIPLLNFGYVPAELCDGQDPSGRLLAQGSLPAYHASRETLSLLYSLRPQTLSFSLCDSPVGLLSALLDIIHTRAPPPGSPLTSRSRSPFLSPVELEMQGSHAEGSAQAEEITSEATEGPQAPFSPLQSELNARIYTWSPTEVLDWTMIQWLPGPEASLRWLNRAHVEALPWSPLSTSYCPVPLGISSFSARNTESRPSPVPFGSAQWQVAWVKRHQRPAALPAWEAPDLLVLDMRECFCTFLTQRLVANLPIEETRSPSR